MTIFVNYIVVGEFLQLLYSLLLQVPAVALQGATLYGVATKEYWSILSLFPLSYLFLGHSFMK